MLFTFLPCFLASTIFRIVSLAFACIYLDVYVLFLVVGLLLLNLTLYGLMLRQPSSPSSTPASSPMQELPAQIGWTGFSVGAHEELTMEMVPFGWRDGDILKASSGGGWRDRDEREGSDGGGWLEPVVGSRTPLQGPVRLTRYWLPYPHSSTPKLLPGLTPAPHSSSQPGFLPSGPGSLQG